MRSRSVVVVDVGVENVADERRVLSDGGNHRARTERSRRLHSFHHDLLHPRLTPAQPPNLCSFLARVARGECCSITNQGRGVQDWTTEARR